ncbi:ribosome maturation factor RimP [bacterium]|nr:ribosome maturation factor RimP [bacterium]
MEEFLPKIEEIIAPIVENSGCELVDIVIAGVGNSTVFRIFVDNNGGITIDKIAKLSSRISQALDSENIFPHKYFLEVSSPGLDRPLRTVRDFKRTISEDVRIVLDDGKTYEGKLLDANSEYLIILCDSIEKEIPFKNIAVGKIVY